jgi:hypothetical protein
MFAVIGIRLYMPPFQKPAFGWAVMHGYFEKAGFFIQFHGEVRRLLVQRLLPILPRAAKAALFYKAFERGRKIFIG